ncbi:Phosphoheptose isomerase [Labeo rohita]|uniref:Phosphoheptose isomerase n=1 Tax=Labeo rohita TaxID=84645 RepID=A0ABQ8MWH0_LABRO|nr:Phosphoheptose isomerase [Labeo rohita]
MGMVPRYTSCDHHSVVSPSIQPLVGPCFYCGCIVHQPAGSSPAISSSGVRRGCNRCTLFTSRGKLNRAADVLSRQLTSPGEWQLHPQTVQLIWSRFGEAQVDLFASCESSHCQLFYFLTEGPLSTDALAHSWLELPLRGKPML